MEKVVNGLFVSVDYTGTLENGEVFDSNQGRPPLEVEMGAGNILKGFEEALDGMTLNEKKTFTLAPEDAFGERNEELAHTFNRSDLPPSADPKVGEIMSLSTQDGQQFPARIAQVDDEKIVVDLNHPLAGQSLTFKIEVVGISDTQTQAPMGCGSDCDCSSDGCNC
jgi:peptidylprolyl isomerase